MTTLLDSHSGRSGLTAASSAPPALEARPHALSTSGIRSSEAVGLRSWLQVAAVVALGSTFWQTNFSWAATSATFWKAAICLTCLVLGVAVPTRPFLERWRDRVEPPALAAAFVYFFSVSLLTGPHDADYLRLLSGAALLVGLGLRADASVDRWRVPLLLAVHVALGVWKIHSDPVPHIDVWVWHKEALEALARGENPYAITMPNIYNDARYYDPSMVVNGRVLTGFQYPPLSLYFAIPGYLLGDYRYSLLFATTLSGACMAYARPGRLSTAAMALWLFLPGWLQMLVCGYTEAMIVMLVALTVLCAVRRSTWLFVPLGLLFASKQYMFVMAAPLVWLLPTSTDSSARHATRNLLVSATLLAAAVTLPLFVINPKAFYECMVLLQLRQPFRPESLSLVAWWQAHFGARLPNWLCFASIVPAAGFVLWRCERSAASFATGLALVSFAFFFLSKQAFPNYYFYSIGALCCAIAVAEPKAMETRTSNATNG
ncbi:MAG: hypothetical protein RL701_377 [Pseudomonadota bacterium]